MFKNFKRYLVTGLITVVPLAAIIYIGWYLFSFLNSTVGTIIYELTGLNFPGISIVISLTVVLMVGVFASFTIGKRAIKTFEKQINKIPLLSDMYKALKQASETFLIQKQEFKTVVLVEYPRKGIKTIGFVTGEPVPPIAKKSEKELVNVFIPTSPNPTSGYLTFIPEEDLEELDISIQKGLKIVFSGGFLTEEKEIEEF